MICTREDDFTRADQIDRGQAQWLVRLSNGLTVIQDDGRPGVSPHSAWLRLKCYCEREGTAIREMWLRFRSREERSVPADADGYFFSRQAVRTTNHTDTLQFYLLGYLQTGILMVQRWKVPELFMVEEQRRDLGRVGPCLIRNGKTANSTLTL